ncbi:hypothetical protein CyaNS01_02850 [Cyanobium sp. NS01]|nr:hypothetical protein CyaNS01_02850 [Cyanobium sp. NS01]
MIIGPGACSQGSSARRESAVFVAATGLVAVSAFAPAALCWNPLLATDPALRCRLPHAPAGAIDHSS